MRWTVKSKLKGRLTSVHYFLEKKPVQLAYDGDDAYQGKDEIESDDNELGVRARVYGLNGTDWSLVRIPVIVIAQSGDCDHPFDRW